MVIQQAALAQERTVPVAARQDPARGSAPREGGGGVQQWGAFNDEDLSSGQTGVGAGLHSMINFL